MSDITMRGRVNEWGQGAILYDFLRVPGGAEKVALQLAQSGAQVLAHPCVKRRHGLIEQQ